MTGEYHTLDWFQSTPPRRERLTSAHSATARSLFQSTPPRRERRAPAASSSDNLKFQSTPPRRERPQRIRPRPVGRRVSIHAPAKGATRRRLGSVRCCNGFNPRPREGSDAGRPCFLRAQVVFQSTPPRRERRFGVLHDDVPAVVSIHAPAKGATSRLPGPRRQQWFQSTPPRRERRRLPAARRPRRSFNPRPREGSDNLGPNPIGILIRVSIHAPAKGATLLGLTRLCRRTCFNPRPREGSDHRLIGERAGTVAVSIHAPAKGATLEADYIKWCGERFQSTPPRRERPLRCRHRCVKARAFQSTPPRRERPVAARPPLNATLVFQSTPPRRERLLPVKDFRRQVPFQSTPPRRERPRRLRSR